MKGHVCDKKEHIGGNANILSLSRDEDRESGTWGERVG